MRTNSEIIRPAGPENELDRVLIEEYAKAEVALDQLAYSEAFEALFGHVCNRLNLKDSQQARHDVFHRLLTLRKMARLPRLPEPISKTSKVAY